LTISMISIKPIVSNASKTARINQHHSRGHPTNESLNRSKVCIHCLFFHSKAQPEILYKNANAYI